MVLHLELKGTRGLKLLFVSCASRGGERFGEESLLTADKGKARTLNQRVYLSGAARGRKHEESRERLIVLVPDP